MKKSIVLQSTSADFARAERLAQHEIGYIPNHAFSKLDDRRFLELAQAFAPIASHTPGQMPAYLARLCATELLTPEREREAFQLMNAAKARAEILRRKIHCDRPDPELLDRIEALMNAAHSVRDTIVGANTRLVMSIVKTLVTRSRRFDELLSDGLAILLHAVEKFDVERGFRFSTYAHRTISRNAFRIESKSLRDRKRFPNLDAEFDIRPDHSGPPMLQEREYETLSVAMRRLIERLDRRERFIVRGRFAFGGHRRIKTFQELGKKLGISKERVRQLERRAMVKLRRMVVDSELREFCAEFPFDVPPVREIAGENTTTEAGPVR